MSTLRQLRWMDCRRIVDATDSDGLQTLLTPHDFADRACAFIGRLEASASQAGHMQENVGQVLIRNDKAVSLRRIEPLDRPYHFEDIRFDFPVMLNTALQSWQIFAPIVTSPAPRS